MKPQKVMFQEKEYIITQSRHGWFWLARAGELLMAVVEKIPFVTIKNDRSLILGYYDLSTGQEAFKCE